MPNLRIPNLVKHMTVAIYREGKISARSKKDKFLQCLAIAKSRCQQYGFVVLAGDKPDADIGLTAKGRARELKHRAEGRAKTVLFDTLYDLYDLDGAKAKARLAEKQLNAERTAAQQEEKRNSASGRNRLR